MCTPSVQIQAPKPDALKTIALNTLSSLASPPSSSAGSYFPSLPTDAEIVVEHITEDEVAAATVSTTVVSAPR